MTAAIYIDTSSGAAYERVRYPNTGPSYVWQTGNQLTSRFTESRPASLHSVRNPVSGYSEQLPWQHVTTYTTSGRSYALSQDVSGRTGEFGCAGRIFFDPVTANESALMDYAIQRALAGLSEPLMQMRVFFRELEKALKLVMAFGNAAQAGLHGLADLCNRSHVARNSMRRFLRHGWKEVPSFYLAYIFGIAPLGEDIVNAVNRLMDLKNNHKTFRLAVRSKIGTRVDYVTQAQPIFDARYYVNVQRSMTARACLSFDIPIDRLMALQYLTPFSEAYETTRLSFVLDYIWPAQGWIQAIEACQISPYFVKGTKSLKVVDTILGGYVSMPGLVSSVYEPKGSGRQYQRQTFSSFPYGSVFRPPRLKMPSRYAIAPIAALIGQRLTSLSKALSRK